MNATTHGISPQQYLDRVRAALSDLPADEREELLEDLPAHLADVESELDGALEQRLGSPEEYAAELRQSAGIGPSRKRVPVGLTARANRRIAAFSAELDDIPLWRRFRAFAPQLLPGWWVLRGYVLALAACSIFGGLDISGLTPKLNGDLLLFIPLAVALIWASVWIGQRGRESNPWRRRGIYGINILTVILFFSLASHQPSYGVGYSGSEYAGPLASVTDVYAYDSEGKPLRGVQLFDQYGNPIVLPGGYYVRDYADGTGQAENVYPRGPHGPTYRDEHGLPSPPATVAPLAPGDAIPGDPPASVTPPAGASPSPSVRPTPSASPSTPTPAPSR